MAAFEFMRDRLAHVFLVENGQELHEIRVSPGEVRRDVISDTDKQLYAGEYAEFRKQNPDLKDAEVPENDSVKQDAAIREHLSGLAPDLIAVVRGKLLATTHTAPQVERALEAAMNEIGLVPREPEGEPRP